MRAWRKPETIVFHEQFWTPAARMADIVLPATTSLERDDIGYGSREPYLIAMKKAREPVGEARDDFWIFAELAKSGDGERLMIDATHLKAHRTAASLLKKGLYPAASGAAVAA